MYRVDTTLDELEALNRVILAAEDWAPEYRKNKESLADLIKIEARFERNLLAWLREFAHRAPDYVRWTNYDRLMLQQVLADDFTVDVYVDDEPLEDGLAISVLFESISEAVALGIITAEEAYIRYGELESSSEIIQRAALKRSAELVGKRVDKNGNVVDNPNAKYSITETMRRDIRRSLSTSVNLREDHAAATKRMQKVIRNPRRAEVIARTETVNSFNDGLLITGEQTGAKGKEWQTNNYDDICGVNAREGEIPLHAKFASGHLKPTAHPNCLCALLLIYD